MPIIDLPQSKWALEVGGTLVGRLQSLDWTGGLDWWTGLVDWTGRLTLKIIFMPSNGTCSPTGLHDASY